MNEDMTDAEMIAYREQFAIKKYSEMPEAYTWQRTLFPEDSLRGLR